MHDLIRRQAVLIFILIGLLLTPIIIKAHEIRPAIVDLTFNSAPSTSGSHGLVIDVMLNLESLIAGIGPGHENTDTSENTDVYQTLRTMEPDLLLAEFDNFKQHFLAEMKVTAADNKSLPITIRSIDIPPVGNLGVPRDSKIVLSTELPDNTVALRWQWSEMFGEAIVRANSDAVSLDYATLLTPGQQTDLIQFTTPTKQSAWSVITNYILVGFEHILPKGLDHILFVIGLCLLTTQWKTLALQVTAFTLAHSLTLALGASGLLRISPD